MGTINNTNVGPAGQVISSTAVDAKFTDVATATGSLDVNNVRSEGVARRTLAASRAEPLAHMSYTDNGTANGNYASQTGESVFLVNHGTDLLLTPNFTIKAGDLLRINFTIRLKNHNDAPFKPLYTGGPTLSIGVIFFPVWKTGGAGAFSVLPDQTLLNNNVTAPAFIAFNDANLRTDSSAWCSMEGLTSGGICDCRNTVHGAYYYKHTGGDMVINEVRLNGRGPVAYEWDTGTSQKVIRVPDWSAAPYVSWPTSWTFNLGEGQLSMTVLRGDS